MSHDMRIGGERMQFPKRIMSITELVNMGFAREQVRCFVRIPGEHAFKTAGKGKWLIDTVELDKLIKKINR